MRSDSAASGRSQFPERREQKLTNRFFPAGDRLDVVISEHVSSRKDS